MVRTILDHARGDIADFKFAVCGRAAAYDDACQA
jgi:hypothetical protein